jgi:ribosomal-protein-alanine N-acetyltransferase
MKYIPRPLAKTLEDALEHIASIDDKLIKKKANWGITLKQFTT